MESRVVVSGLRETSRNLKALSEEAQKEMSAAMKDIAASVVPDVQAKMPVLTGKARKTVKARGGTKGASIAYGGTRAPYVPFLDWGGTVPGWPGRGGVQNPKEGWPGKKGHRPVKRPVEAEGRYLYPAIAENMDKVLEAVVEALNRINRKYGGSVDE